jgi:hypothetical protein
VKTDYYNRRINESIAKAMGYRRWRFGDRWVKGLILLDTRFNNYPRRVIKDATASEEYVEIDIDELRIHHVRDIKADYIPGSHWVSPEGKISVKPPNFINNLNAMAVAESILTADEMLEYDRLLPLQGVSKCANTALSRALCWLRAKNIEY